MNISLFALSGGHKFGEKVANHLGISLNLLEEREFEDGEHKARSLESVRNKDVFVIYSLYSDQKLSVNDKICRLLFFIGALKDASAKRVTAVIPYFAYARKDRKTKDYDPVTMKYMAKLFEAVRTDHVLTIDVHNIAAFQNALRISSDHLEGSDLFASYIADNIPNEEFTVISPDAGGIKRAEKFREKLEVLLERDVYKGFIEKKRSGGIVSGDMLIGDVEGKVVIVVDDIISSGTTMERASLILKEAGASKVIVVATHGIFVGEANSVLLRQEIDQIIISNTISPFRLSEAVRKKVTILDVSKVFADRIKKIYGEVAM